MKSYLLLSFYAGFVVVRAFTTHGWKIEDHYWRDYTGQTPSDALEAGTDKHGLPIFIGQAFIKDIGLLPVTIYSQASTVEATAWDKVFSLDKNVKILCSQNPGEYRWVPTKIENMHLLTHCSLVPGGTETETTLYIGRVIHDMELAIGKVYPNFSQYKGLGLPHNGKQATYYSFEVFAHNCTVNKNNCV
ncbi:hypothetical protein PPYR_00599 [Photinus pyralis]|uniref:Uncharacterized protein n=2 Tax=Photinus pyralis TaxID=7054 RepID=A0A5N4B1Z6_PHOPY|nr:uncharacterized protein LOC116159546 [Photinus pyralis]KAB0803629.1 hypothetical protein PPYR_00599 [Photinus pyralis]